MQTVVWIVLAAIAAALGYGGWLLRRRWIERARAASTREAEFMARLAQAKAMPSAQAAPSAQATPSPVPVARKDPGTLPQQRLLFEAAAKAAEAGEPVLSIQLYARLLARYPDSGFAGQVRAAVEVQKKKLGKG